MGSLIVDNGNIYPEVYRRLGFKELKKGASRTPRVLTLLSSILEKAVEKNEKLREMSETKDVTVFHALRAPAISIWQYIDRIFKYSYCSPTCFVIAHIYMDRFLEQTCVRLTALNVHRLLITSVMLAAKFNDDAFFNNAYYATVGGITTTELNRLEMKFLFTLDFGLQVNLNTFGTYCYQMERETSEALEVERLIKACR
ncbi:hypothetical protein K2173_003074 [Erythroxylum novogranatense]|uniref:Cyclin n=1 Tax=Erythroxylum novogranatense TaxID=1862640 RepID=A0AAV8T9V2_9ROSI|nr:hypothetical protein K2173_003074 [Erythroxylum novogranatense]